VGESIDDICVIPSMHTNRPIHESSLFMMNSGDIQPGRPSMGSWITYGLGTENQNLPVRSALPWSARGRSTAVELYLSAGCLSGTHICNNESELQKLIQYIHNDRLNLADQRDQLELLEKLNRHMQQRYGDAQLESGIWNPGHGNHLLNADRGSWGIRSAQGEQDHSGRVGEGDFALGCLMARRLVERGVRVVQAYFGNSQPWDNHDDILIHAKLARQSDKPIAALLKDLKARGLLSDTLVICGSEFGRTPVVEKSAAVKVQNGRDHNNYVHDVAGRAVVKGGMAYGATDDFGFRGSGEAGACARSSRHCLAPLGT
jgi:hypothetical protein